MEKRLQRDERDKMIGGVCAGLGEYFGIDVSLVRIAFVVAVMFGAGVLAYIILWIVMPRKPFNPYNPYAADYKVYDQTVPPVNPAPGTYQAGAPFIPVPPRRAEGSGKIVAGLIFVAFGTYFMFDEFDLVPHWFELDKLWPLIFIIPGLILLSKSKRKPWEEEVAAGQPAQDNVDTEPVSPSGTSTEQSEDKL